MNASMLRDEYRARAAVEADAAAKAELEQVRTKHVRAAAIWTELAQAEEVRARQQAGRLVQAAALRAARDLKLVSWSRALNSHAGELEGDANAAHLLVHRVLTAAFAVKPDGRGEAALKRALHAAIDTDFSASRPLGGGAENA